MEKAILFLSYDGITDPLGQSQILPYVKGIAQNGYRFLLISAEKNRAYASTMLKEELISSGIRWMPVSYTKHPPVFSTLYDLWKMNRQVKNVLRSSQIELIHCRGYITAILGLYYKTKKNIPFVFDMRGFFADERKDAKNWNTRNPVYKIIYQWFKKKEIDFFTHADYTISLTEKGKNIILKEIVPSINTNIKVIPCCVDLERFNPEENHRSQLRNELNIPDNGLVFTYLGSVGTWYLLNEMIAFFNAVESRFANCYFLFISNEPETIIRDAVLKNHGNLQKFRFTRQPQSQVPAYLSVSDWGLFFILPCFSKQASSPTKLAEFLAMGIPVITNRGVGDVDDIVTRFETGVLVKGFEDPDYAAACREISEYKRRPDTFYREIVKENFSTQIAIERYLSVYKEVLSSS